MKSTSNKFIFRSFSYLHALRNVSLNILWAIVQFKINRLPSSHYENLEYVFLSTQLQVLLWFFFPLSTPLLLALGEKKI